MEELQAKHRKEQKDLQSRITQKKKQASKKTRKGVNDECEKLEAELKERQAQEIAVLNGEVDEQDVDATSGDLEALSIIEPKVDGEAEEHVNGIIQAEEVNHEPGSIEGGTGGGSSKKPNRAKARLARRAAEQEEQARQAAAEAKNLPDQKTQERERMLAATKGKGLAEKEIRADGHCLYSAIADQLTAAHIPLTARENGTEDSTSEPAYKTIRSAAADYISHHADNFLPFLEEPLEDYVHKIRSTAEWGGQLELLALAKSYGVEINVLQDFGRVERISGRGDGESEEKEERRVEEGREIWLAYYKHGFGLGEHYNSLRRAGTGAG